MSAAFVLAFVDFLDELGAGLAPVSAADIRDEFGLAYGGAALVLLVGPLLLSLLIESPLLLLSDGWRRDRMAGIALFVMGLCMLAAAVAPSAWVFALALGGWASAGGVACGVSQGALMDAFPHARERWMTRWTLMGALGDTACPALVLASVALGFGWRGALATAAIVHLAHAPLLARSMRRLAEQSSTASDEEEDDDEESPPLLERVRAGLRDPTLLAWLTGSALCCLLDEILVAFGAMFLRDELGADIPLQTAAFTACAIAGALGLVLTDRLLRPADPDAEGSTASVDPIRLLVLASIACALALGIWLGMRTIVGSIIALALVGVFVAPLYPICAARAYAARPGEAGLVAAIDQLFTPFAVVAPIAVGLIADRFGVVVALAVLLLQPIGVGALGVLHILRVRPRQS